MYCFIEEKNLNEVIELKKLYVKPFVDYNDNDSLDTTKNESNGNIKDTKMNID